MASNPNNNDQYPIYLGVWTNWSRGQVLGRTLTLEREEANLLIAFTAFFIAFVSTRFWRIICFAFHRSYATADRRDVIHHQTQAILRNSSTPESGIQFFLSLIWTVRNGHNRLHPILLAVVAVTCIAAFTVAGGFSSQISTAVGTEVLISSQNCGYLDRTKLNGSFGNGGLDIEAGPDLAGKTNNAATYAQQCYSKSVAGTFDCGRYTSKSLKSTIDSDALCPFQEDLCRSNSTNLRIDSGFIDSHKDFGLNAPPEDRVLSRYVLHCAPIKTQGYTSQVNTSIGTLTAYHYGNISTPLGPVDYIWSAESVRAQYAAILAPDAGGSFTNYQLSGLSVIVANKQYNPLFSAFQPIDSIFRQDADINVYFLSGEGVLQSAPSDDEWYRVSSKPVNTATVTANSSEVIPLYIPLEPASPLGCAGQYQFCHSDTQHCGPLASLFDAIKGAALLFNTTADTSGVVDESTAGGGLLKFVLAAFNNNEYGTLSTIPTTLGATSLASQRTLYNNIQGLLPSNQWQMDVTHWWDIYMSSLQQAFLNIAYISPQSSSELILRSSFASASARKLCNNQKIRSTAHASFSLFGLLFTFIVGVLISLVSYLLEPISRLLYRKRGFKSYAHLEWTTQTTLQLQRLAHEEINSGTWSNGTQEIPTTKTGDLLASLDISNPDHPVLTLPYKDDRSLADTEPVKAGLEQFVQAYRHPSNSSSTQSTIRQDMASKKPQLTHHDAEPIRS